MEKTIIKKQNAEMFFKETFHDVIEQFGISNIFFCGRKMYIRIKKIIISVEFTGTNMAFSNIVLMVTGQNGIIDQNITPLNMIFKESKVKSVQDKIVNIRVVMNMTGEYSMVWSCDLTDNDLMNINNIVISYAELFSTL